MSLESVGRFPRAVVVTVSDRGARGEREDLSGPAVARQLADAGFDIVARPVVPDEMDAVAEMLIRWSDGGGTDLVVTTGGTGPAPRDVTPEATLKVVERTVPGMAEAMRAAGLLKTPSAMLSRGVVGIRGTTLIVNLPGRPKGAQESLAAILPVIPHALMKIQGDPNDCAES